MQVRYARRYLGVVLLAVVAACGKDSTGPKSYSANGTWQGTGSGFTMRLTLAQNSQQVTGDGTITASGNGGSLAVSVTGTNVSPNLSLTLHATGYEDLNVSGTFVSSSTVNATLSGSGFNGETLTFQKQ